jgi:hypothetical protein
MPLKLLSCKKEVNKLKRFGKMQNHKKSGRFSSSMSARTLFLVIIQFS